MPESTTPDSDEAHARAREAAETLADLTMGHGDALYCDTCTRRLTDVIQGRSPELDTAPILALCTRQGGTWFVAATTCRSCGPATDDLGDTTVLATCDARFTAPSAMGDPNEIQTANVDLVRGPNDD